MNDADYLCEHCGTYFPIRVMATEHRIGHVTEQLSYAQQCGDLETMYVAEAELERLNEQLRKLTSPDR